MKLKIINLVSGEVYTYKKIKRLKIEYLELIQNFNYTYQIKIKKRFKKNQLLNWNPMIEKLIIK